MSKPRGTRASPPPDRAAAPATARDAGLWPRFRPWAPVLLVFGLALFCYWPALHGTLLWDDPAHVTRPEMRSWAGLARVWGVGATQEYYPVLFSAFWLESQLWGDAVVGYHLLNVLLHAASCCLLALVLRRLWNTGASPAAGSTGSPQAGSAGSPQASPRAFASGPAAAGPERRRYAGAEWLAALLFAVHPVCVESVAWITEQKNTLSLFFYLASGLAYLRYTERRRWPWYGAALGLFVLALGAKTATVTLPAALLVVAWWRHGGLAWRRDILPLLPWFLAAAGAGLVTVVVETKFVGAEGAAFGWSAGQRVLLASRVVWFYLGKLAWPVDLNFYYTHWDVVKLAGGWWGYLGAAIGVTGALWAFRRRWRGPLAGWLLFVGSLFPVAGFFNVFGFTFSQVADHFQYMAIPVFAAAAAAGAALLLARAPAWARAAGRALVGAVLVVLAVEAHQLSGRYVDNETLFRATAANNPRAWMAYQILGATFAKSPGRQAEAIECFQKVLEIDPDYPDAHVGLAVELAKLPGRGAEAIAHYERALQLRPQYVEAHNNLGFELAKLPGRLPEAIAHFEAALRLAPGFVQAHANLADALIQLPGRLPEAVAQYEAVAALQPGSAAAHYRLAMVLSRTPNRATDAIAQAEEALRLKPDYPDALNALAIIHAQQGRLDRAKEYWERALRIDPNFAPARRNLGLLRQLPPP